MVLTFEPHPRTFFRPDEPVFRLTSPEARARLLTALGLDGLVVATFDRSLSSLTRRAPSSTRSSPGRLKARSITVGEDFHFGKAQSGTTADLVDAGPRHGFAVDVVAPVIDGEGDRFSSSGIREALAAGDIALANHVLGYRWFVTGEVIAGDRRGRELGFPTANIRLPADCRLRHGIYAVTLHAIRRRGSRRRRELWPAAAIRQWRAASRGFMYSILPAISTGSDVVVTFLDWIRPEMKFPSVEALIAAIATDVETARAMLAGGGGTALDQALAAPRLKPARPVGCRGATGGLSTIHRSAGFLPVFRNLLIL